MAYQRLLDRMLVPGFFQGESDHERIPARARPRKAAGHGARISDEPKYRERNPLGMIRGPGGVEKPGRFFNVCGAPVPGARVEKLPRFFNEHARGTSSGGGARDELEE